jgi:ribosomal RNA-processing protein 1
LSLRTFLSGRRKLSELDLLKLWKGLFYCMWMCDRPRPQAALADSLADLVSVVPSQNTLPFLRAFWKTMAREWTNIDVLRMEKFLLLTRRYLLATLRVAEKAKWEVKKTQPVLDLLAEFALNCEDMRIPNGMRYHVIDIYVDELEKVGVLGEDADEERVELLLQPLKAISVNSPTKTVRVKAKEA